MDEETQKCNWDHKTDCRHPEWWESAQNIIDSMNLSLGEVTQQVEMQFDKLKEGCKLCLIADLNRQIRLLRITGGE